MPQTPKLCIDARMYRNSGIGKYLQMLLPYMVKEFEVTLLGDPASLEVYHPHCQIINFTRPIYSISEQLSFPMVVPKTDIFWSPHYNVPIFPVRAKKRVVTIHDVYHLAHRSELSLTKRLYADLVMRMAVAKSDRIITVSEFSKAEILKYTKAGPGKVDVIYNGCENGTLVNDDVKVKYKLPDRYILFVGNVKPHKNLRDLLDAYLLLSEELRSGYKIVIAGKKDGFITGDQGLVDRIASNPLLKENVLFTGYVDQEDIDSIYALASLFVFPSLYEGFGLPPLEAMANNCPVIASNAASIPEICGDGALYFSPGDVEELKDQITAVLTDPELRQRLIATGLETVRRFSWQKTADEHINIFKHLLTN